MNKQNLDIVLRVCDTSDVHPERGERFISCDKQTLIKKCLNSLLISIDAAKDISDTKLWILSDNSTEDLIEYIILKCKNFNYELVLLDKKGYNYSALKQFEYCRDKGRQWVYSVEDDYFHFTNSISNLILEINKFCNYTGTKVALRPDDDLFTYSENTTYANKGYRIILGNTRHWRTLHTCHNTLFTHVDIFKEYWEIFASLAKFFKKIEINEDKTINLLWSDGVNNNGPVPLFSPIPTLAFHISQGNEPIFLDWKKYWDDIKL